MRLKTFLPNCIRFTKLILLCCWLVGCGSEEKPSNLIQEDKMAKVLAETHILEAQINNMRFQHEDSSIFVYHKKRAEIVKSFQLDTATFSISLKYFLMNPDKMKEIYVDVKKILEAKKKVIENNSKAEEIRKKRLEQKNLLKDKNKLNKIDSTSQKFKPINKRNLTKKVSPNLP